MSDWTAGILSCYLSWWKEEVVYSLWLNVCSQKRASLQQACYLAVIRMRLHRLLLWLDDNKKSSKGFMQVDCQIFLSTSFVQVVSTSSSKFCSIKLIFADWKQFDEANLLDATWWQTCVKHQTLPCSHTRNVHVALQTVVSPDSMIFSILL